MTWEDLKELRSWVKHVTFAWRYSKDYDPLQDALLDIDAELERRKKENQT